MPGRKCARDWSSYRWNVRRRRAQVAVGGGAGARTAGLHARDAGLVRRDDRAPERGELLRQALEAGDLQAQQAHGCVRAHGRRERRSDIRSPEAVV